MSEPVDDRERDVDGKFAPKKPLRKTKQTKRKGRAANLPKRGPGRPKGSKNKATVEWKEFCMKMTRDPEVQELLLERVRQRPELALKVAEHAVGKPKETQDIEIDGTLTVKWED